MPTYDYICQTCDKRFDYFQSMSSPSLKSNPNCEDKNCHVKRVVSGGSGLIFKGSGFYLTDYKNKKKKSNSESNTDSKTVKEKKIKSKKKKKGNKKND